MPAAGEDGAMRLAWAAWGLGTALGLGGAWACGDTGADECPIGSHGCACTVGGACDVGLSCLAGSCEVLPGGTDGTSASDSDTGMSAGSGSSATAASTITGMTESDTSAGDSSGGGGPKLDVGGGETGPISGCGKIDMLFVLDSSGSMIEERQALAATNAVTGIITTLEGLNGGGIDYRIGVTDDDDNGFHVPPGWAGPNPWFDSTELDDMAMALAVNGAVGAVGGEPPIGCEHVLTSGTDLLLGDATGFVRDDALLVLLMLTDVDDYGDYDQQGGNTCGLGCATPPKYTPPEAEDLLSSQVKGGQVGAVAAIVIAGDPGVAAGMNFCGQPGSCGCNGIDCGVFHATKLFAFADLLDTNGYAADLCLVGNAVPATVEAALTDSIDAACMNFEPAG